MDVKMLILWCCLIILELKVSEGKGVGTHISSGRGGTGVTRTGTVYQSIFRNENFVYIPTPYWKNGANKYFGNKYDRKFITGSSFLTMGLFNGKSGRHLWDSEQDRRWRYSTKAPYFENKQPGTKSILPASAVVGAATAFGVYSLLPLNVPSEKPIISCNATALKQSQIKLNDNIYYCVNASIKVSRLYGIEEKANETNNEFMKCDSDTESNVLFCTNGTLFSSKSIVCNETNQFMNIELNETTSTLNCYFGSMLHSMTSTVPTEAPEYAVITEKTTKEVSLAAKVHIFLLWTIGKLHILDIKTKMFEHEFLSYEDTEALIDTVPLNRKAFSYV
ncbi:unnamed protein product [Diamesa tonsa]